ncbi:MAG: YxlC family protein [Paenibacillaceae bacterium]
MTNNKERWEQELQQGLDQMGGWVTPVVADVHMWEQIIVEERRSERKKLRRELSFFWIIAVIVLILGLISFTQLPFVFVVVQVGALLGFPLYWAFKARKKVTIQ